MSIDASVEQQVNSKVFFITHLSLWVAVAIVARHDFKWLYFYMWRLKGWKTRSHVCGVAGTNIAPTTNTSTRQQLLSLEIIRLICWKTQMVNNLWAFLSEAEGVRSSPSNTKQIQDVESMVFQCWATVCDAGPTLKYHWFNVLYLLGIAYIPLMVECIL